MNPPAFFQHLLPTLYEDDQVLAVGKPAGSDVGAGREGSAPGLVDALVKCRGGKEALLPANRLNRHESGVLLLGKHPEIAAHIRAGIRSNRIIQEYVAVVLGPVAESTLVIDSRHGASRGRRRPPAREGRRQARASTRSVAKGETRGGSNARKTTVDVLRRGRGRTLIRCRTTVENTHALRAQLRAAGLRLIGDHLHDRSPRRTAPEHLCLHLTRIAFHHPELKSRINVRCRPPAGFAAMVEGEWAPERPLLAALARRLPGLVESETDSYRLLTGSVEEVKGLVAEKYGCVVILQIFEDRPQIIDSLEAIARWYLKTLGVRAVYTKRFVKGRSAADDRILRDLHSPRPLAGKPVAPQIEITEGGLSFLVRPYDGFSVGLFLDQRENRGRVRALAKGRDVLNLFAYTCGFSVAAAAGGAHSTVSVDISPKHLDWGRANFALNDLGMADHQFIKSPAGDYLKRAKRQEKLFDMVLLDPPSFAHERKGKQTFSVSRDLPELVAGATALLRPGGVMMVSTNYRRLSAPRLRKLVTEGTGRRPFQVMSSPRLPTDFAMDPNHAKTIFIRFE